jgi:Family of unknown function (DUF6463)
MANFASWALLILGVAHVLFGFVKFRTPLLASVRAGFIGKFSSSELQRTAFWFVIFGPLLMMVGHLCIRAAAVEDYETIRIVGLYATLVSIVGISAFPKSPFIVSLVVALMLVAVGYRIL